MKESKRLLSWISLGVLLLTNTMTPFSYADVEGGDLVDVQEPATIEAPVEEIPSDETPSDDIPEVVNPVDDGDDQPVNIDPIEQPVEPVDDIEPVEPTEPVEDVVEPVELAEEVEPVEPVNPTDNNGGINDETPADIEDSDKVAESEDKIEGEEKDIDDKLLELLEGMDNKGVELNIMQGDDASHWTVGSGFYDLDVKGADGKTLFTIMDRNLGATTTGYGDTDTAYGYYYQWGNNYGFDPNNITSNKTDVDAGNNGPDNYYYSNIFKKNYVWDLSYNYNLWGGEYISSGDSVRQGPCPAGYHVPLINEWNTAVKLRCTNKKGTGENCNKTAEYYDDFQKDLFLSLGGMIKSTTAQLDGEGTKGLYWSSYNDSMWSVKSFKIDSNGFGNSSESQGNALQVRCFKNTNNINIIYKTNGGSLEGEYPESARWWEFQEIELPEPKLDRNVFKGWYTTSDFQEGSKVTNKILVRSSDENVKLYADWEECGETQAYSWDLGICYNPENAIILRDPITNKVVQINEQDYGTISILRPETLTDEDGPKGLIIMDRNLGAKSNNTGDESSVGYHYQWGNNYGFPGNGPTSDVDQSNSQIEWKIEYDKSNFVSPVFIKTDEYDYWNDGNHNGLWGGDLDGVDNNWGAKQRNSLDRQGPCPKGFHVPSAGEWGLLQKYRAIKNGKSYTGENGLFYLKSSEAGGADFLNDFKLPHTFPYEILSYGSTWLYNFFYWTSSPLNDADGKSYHLRGEFEGKYGAPIFTNGNRSDGYTVRCFANPEEVFYISFNSNGGTVIDSQLVMSGEQVIKPEDPELQGYNFLGWYIDEDLTEEFNFDEIVNSDIVLYAKWSDYGLEYDDLNLIFITNTGNKVEYTIMDRNIGATEPYNQKYSSEVNNGSLGRYYKWANFDKITGKSGICPKGYHIPSFDEITNISNVRSVSNILTTGLGKKFSSDFLLPPTGYSGYQGGIGKYGYYWTSTPYSSGSSYYLYLSIDSLFKGSSNISSAGYTVRCIKDSSNSSNINIHLNGGNSAIVAFTGSVGNGKITSLGESVNGSLNFEGWYSDSGFNNEIIVGDNVPTDLYVKWESLPTYLFNANKGVFPNGNSFEILNSKKHRIQLDITNNNNRNELYQNVIYFPGATKIHLEGTFSPSCENNKIYFYKYDRTKFSEGETIQNPLKRQDLTFNFDVDGDVITIESIGSSCPVLGYNGTATAIGLKEYTIDNFEEIPVLTGYTFSGWYESGALKPFDFTGTEVTQDRIFYAKWNPNKYTIQLDSNGGNASQTEIDARYGEEMILPNATRDGYVFKGWKDENGNLYVSKIGEDESLTTEDGVTVTLTAQWEENKSNDSGSSSGGGKRVPSSDQDHGAADDKKTDDKKSENMVNDADKTDNQQKDVSDNDENKSDKFEKSDISESIESQTDTPSEIQVQYTNEQKESYSFAKSNGITTTSSIKEAKMNTSLKRIEMAKMLSYYAINVLGQEPDTSKGIVKFNDVSNKMDKQYDNGVTLSYQLGIMGQNMPKNKFRPNDEVTRAEFVTALSRMIYNTQDGKGNVKYYEPHMAKLYNEGIISNTNPKMKEKRGYVMTMLMRSAK